MKDSNENLYETSDLALITTLSLYFPIESVARDNTKKVLFVFSRTQELDDLMGKYWAGKLRVEPQAFFNQIKIIKTRIYGQT